MKFLSRLYCLLSILTLALLASGCGRTEPVHQGKSLSEWIEALNTKDLRKHADAVDGLTAIGTEAIPALAAKLEDVDADIRCGSATALLRIDPKAGLEEIGPRLKSGTPRVKISMCLALIRANVEPGLAIPVLAATMLHEEYYVHNQSIKALGELGPQSVGAVLALAELLRQHANPDVRWRAAFALVRIGPGAAPAAASLIAALADSDCQVREGAAYALGAIGPAASSAKNALRIALKDSNPIVRRRAAKALGKLKIKR